MSVLKTILRAFWTEQHAQKALRKEIYHNIEEAKNKYPKIYTVVARHGYELIDYVELLFLQWIIFRLEPLALPCSKKGFSTSYLFEEQGTLLWRF